MQCPRCKSEETRKHGFRLLGNGKRKQLYQCKNCGHVFAQEGGES